MKIETIVINWRGPFTIEEVQNLDDGDGIYLLTGRKKYQRRDHIQYCGITAGLFRNRLSQKHHVLPEITRNLNVWLGQIAYPSRFKRHHLELAEHCIIHFLWPPCNKTKLYKFPLQAWIISQWFTRAGVPRINRLSIYREMN